MIPKTDSIAFPGVAVPSTSIRSWSLVLDFKILWRTVFEFGRPEPTPIEDRLNVERAKAANKS